MRNTSNYHIPLRLKRLVKEEQIESKAYRREGIIKIRKELNKINN